MALITCPECGAKISDSAPTCVKCGFQLITPQQPQPVKKKITPAIIIAGVIILGLLLFIIFVIAVPTYQGYNRAYNERTAQVAVITVLKNLQLATTAFAISQENEEFVSILKPDEAHQLEAFKEFGFHLDPDVSFKIDTSTLPGVAEPNQAIFAAYNARGAPMYVLTSIDNEIMRMSDPRAMKSLGRHFSKRPPKRLLTFTIDPSGATVGNGYINIDLYNYTVSSLHF